MSRDLDGNRVSDIEYCLACFEREARPAGTTWTPDDCPLYGVCPANVDISTRADPGNSTE